MGVNVLQIVGGWINGAWALLTSIPADGVVFGKAFAVTAVPPGALAANGLPPASLTGSNARSNGFKFVDLAPGATFPSPTLVSPTLTTPTVTGPTTSTAIATDTTTDGSTVTLYTITGAVPAPGKLLRLRYTVLATINGDASTLTSAAFVRDVYVQQTLGGSPSNIEKTGLDALGTPFVSSGSLAAGGTHIGGSGANLLVQVEGIATTAYSNGGTFPRGLVSNGGKSYWTAGGTDGGSSSGGPTSTTSPQTVDGVTYQYIASASPPSIVWTLVDLELYGPST